MRNGQVKHSSKLGEVDLAGERAIAAYFKRDEPTLWSYMNRPGFYVGYGPRKNEDVQIKGPFNSPEQAIEAHREWTWELKHS